MEGLLASLSQKTLLIERGEEVEGQVVAITDREVILDLGTKAEGTLPLKDLPSNQRHNLKIGDSLKSFVVEPENESGQVLLSSFKIVREKNFTRTRSTPFWDKFIQAKQQNNQILGKVVDSNKGGLIVESQGIRGFLPSSQIGASALVSEDVKVFVSEVDQANNKLIFSQKGMTDEESLKKTVNFKPGQKLEGKILKVFPFGITLEIDGMVGMVSMGELAWEKVDVPGKLFKVGDQVTAVVSGVDLDFGRLNLSLKKTATDPFTALSQKYHPDETVKGKIIEAGPNGVLVALTEGVEGFIAASKLKGQEYSSGQETTFLVDSVDVSRRKINLVPFLTSTKGLIYK